MQRREVMGYALPDALDPRRKRDVRTRGVAARRRLLPLGLLVGFLGCSTGNGSNEADGSAVIPKKDASPEDAMVVPHGDASTPMPDAKSTPEDVYTPPSCNPATTRGATVAYQEYEAESGSTNGTLLGPSRAVNDPDVFNSIAGESSGREAVKLSATGQSVSFTTSCVANSVVVRYVIPDSSDGSGMTATLGLYVAGTRVQSLALTSRYTWAYGNPETTDQTTNTPSDGFARHFYDEVRVLLPSNIPMGTTVALQQDASDTAAYYVIDLVDLEEVAPALAQPASSLSVTDYGATPNDTSDDGAAIQKCINAASIEGKEVWIPAGTYLDAGTTLTAQNVTIQGAGMWQSVIQGAAAAFVCSGGSCKFSDFAIYGDVTLRDDGASVHAFGGPFGAGSEIDNVWMEHFTTGPWIGQSGSPPIDGMTIQGCRIRDLYADGVNLNTSTSNTNVTQCQARNTGDDAFASWSSGNGPNANNVFQFDTVQVTWRANCYAIYGGTSNSVEDSVCADTVTYPGIFIDQDFNSSPFGGTTTIARDSLLRAGGTMYSKSWGALTVDGDQQSNAITGVQVQNVDIESATFSGIYLLGPNDAIQGLVLDGVTIGSPGTYGINVDPSATGTATATNVVVTSPGLGTGLDNQAPSVYTIDRGGGDVGW
jgi:Pectate lyase superfamily protein